MPANFRLDEPDPNKPAQLEYAPSPEEDESFDDEGMSVQKRRLLFLAAVVLLAIFIFVWNAFLNFGKIVITAEPPYSVLVFGEKSYECSENPCVIKLKRGEKNLSFFRPGYKTEGKTVEVPIWDKVEITRIFELEPYIQEIEKFDEKPFVTATIGYKIEYDSIHHNWKLFKSDDKSRRGLSYFPEKLNNPLIFGSNSAVLIIERDAEKAVSQIYFVDLKTGERNAGADFSPRNEPRMPKASMSPEPEPFKITAAKPSLNGKYFLLKVEGETPAMMFAGKDGLTVLNTPETFTTSLWTPFNKLVVVTKEKIDLYDPEANSAYPAKTLIDSMKLENPPSNLFVSPSSTKVYFESPSKKYQVIY